MDGQIGRGITPMPAILVIPGFCFSDHAISAIPAIKAILVIPHVSDHHVGDLRGSCFSDHVRFRRSRRLRRC